MSGGSELVLVSADREAQRSVHAACEAAGLPEPTLTEGLVGLESSLREDPHGLVVVDLGADPLIELSRLAPLLMRHPEARVVLLSPALESELLLEAMQLGVRHCVQKDAVERDLPAVLRRLGDVDSPASAGPAAGRVVTVIPARGGSGASTVAINLAAELAHLSGQPALLADADIHYGSISSYLGLKAGYGLADVLSPDSTLDGALISTTASVHSEGLHVLVSPVSVDFEQPAPLDLTRLPRMLETARQLYPWTVCDLPRAPLSATAAVARHSAVTLIVFQLCVHDVRSARALRQALEAGGVDPSTILMAANRFRRRGQMVSLEDARQAFGDAEVLTLGNDYESAARAINLGQTLASVAPRSVLRKDIRDLAARLAHQVPVRRAS
jgi:pilus assembly protein CpaE